MKGNFMKVVVSVLSGRNKGKVYDLTEPPNGEAHYVLCEDDVLEFRVQTGVERPDIHLALHELFFEPTNDVIPPTDNKPYYEYVWKPKSIRPGDFRQEAFFHNFCGLAELLVVNRIEVAFETYEVEVLRQLQPIEVLARKLNADRINGMLEFLARNDGRDLAALARITRKYSGFKEGDKTIAFTLDRIEKYVNFIDEVLPSIVRNPIVKMVSRNTIKAYTNHSNITEDSINHLISNPDDLYTVSDVEDALFEFNGDFYGVDKILETEIVEETDLYENQVVHGFIEVLLNSIDGILGRLFEVKVKPNTQTIHGYESLFNKLHLFNTKLNKPCIDRCYDFQNRLKRVKRILEDRLKVKKKVTATPHFTHKAKQNKTYQTIFLMMIEWSRFGSPDWSLQNELNSIQNLTKLFEFYLFCLTKEHVLNYARQFNGGLIASPIDGSDDSRFVFKFNEDIMAELLYEPNIFNSMNEDDALLPDYCNTEAWKPGSDSRTWKGEHAHYNETSGEGFRVRLDGQYTQKQYRIRRAPDVVLRLMGAKDESMLIMDAKYMVSTKAFHEAMPECVMKYLHGIHVGETGQNRSIGLMIVNPDEADVTRHFHHREYSIYGKHPVTPAIMTASIDVAKAHKLDSTIQHDIFRLIELMIDKVSDDGLGEVKVKVDVADLYDNFDGEDEETFTEMEVQPEETKQVEESKTIKIEVKLNQDKPVEAKPEQQLDLLSEPEIELLSEPEPEVREQKLDNPPVFNQAKPAVKPVQPKKLKKPIMALPTQGLLKQDKVPSKKPTRTNSKPKTLEVSVVDKRLNDRELMFDKIDLSGRYVKYELLPNYEEYNALSKQFSIGSLSDIYMTDVGMVFPEVKQREIEVEREISVSIKGSSLVSEDQTTSLKVKFIT